MHVTDTHRAEPTARRRRGLRNALAAGVTALLGAGLVAAGAGTAQAAGAGTWGSFAVSGTSRAFTGSMELGGEFPVTTFTSTARTVSTPSGASVWQAEATPPGERYGSSRSLPYLNQSTDTDGTTPVAAVTTYDFETPTPSAGWSFVLGDVDADQVTITATTSGGAPVAAADLGFEGAYNSCRQPGGWSCTASQGDDVPTWDPATATLTGNVLDTQGATGWFSPQVPLTSLTLSFVRQSGSPIYQTWFAARTAALSGTATLDGAPLADARVTVSDAAGRVVADLTTGADGGYLAPALVTAPGYTVSIVPPEGLTTTPLDADLTDGDTAGVDFAFETPVAPAPTTTATGTVVDEEGEPVADLPVAAAPGTSSAPIAETTTDEDGTFALEELPVETDLVLVTRPDDVAPTVVPFRTPAAGPVDLGTIVVPTAVAPPVTPEPEPTPVPVPVPEPVPAPAPPVAPGPAPVPAPPAPAVPAASQALAHTGDGAGGLLGLGAALLLAGAVVTSSAAVHGRRA